MAKSIFEVELDDTKAKAYFALVEKYVQTMGKLPGLWGKVAAAEQPVVAAIAAQTQLLTRVLEGEKRVAQEAERSERAWTGISTRAKETAASLGRMTLTLAKWTGITGALGAIVGAVSLDRLAESVSGTRRAAGGLGISYGQQQAFGLNLGRFVDPGAVLAAARNALFDITNPAQIGLRAAGINPGAGGGNAASVSAQLLERLPGLFAGTPQGLVLPRARALGLDQFLSPDDIVRFLGASKEERRVQIERFKTDAQNLNLQKDVTRGWQDFNTGLERAGLGIENTLVKNLVGLTAPLEKLAGSVAKATDTFLSGAEKWIEPMGKAIERFAKYLVSPDFERDVTGFKDNLGALASAVGAAAGWIKSFVPADSIPAGPPGIGSRGDLFKLPTGVFSGDNPLFKFQTPPFLKGAQAEGDLLGLVRKLEGSGDAAVSPKGAIGRYQITPDTARAYNRDPQFLTDPIYNEQTAQLILRDLVRRYHGDIDKVLLAYHSGRGAVEQPGKFPIGPEGRGYLDRAHGMPGYQKVIIEIHDATGASAITAGSQIGLGGTP
jgi:hypothetical protein